MLKKLKDILNTYSDEELESMELYVNSECLAYTIIIDPYSIDLVSADYKVISKLDSISKED